jgi:hypothetical protein
MSIQQLETAVVELSEEDLSRFSRWFDEYSAEVWDRRIERDARAGRLDGLIAEAREDIAAGRA